jgi:hypothetical protein
MPPTVARSGHNGSSATNCSCCARAHCSSFQVHPASTVQVMSCHGCSRSVFIRVVFNSNEVAAGASQLVLLREPDGQTESFSESQYCSRAEISSALRGLAITVATSRSRVAVPQICPA